MATLEYVQLIESLIERSTELLRKTIEETDAMRDSEIENAMWKEYHIRNTELINSVRLMQKEKKANRSKEVKPMAPIANGDDL